MRQQEATHHVVCSKTFQEHLCLAKSTLYDPTHWNTLPGAGLLKKPLSLTFRRKTSNNFNGNNIFTLGEEQLHRSKPKMLLSPHATWDKGGHMGGSGVTSVSFQLWSPGRESTKTPNLGLIHPPSITALSAQE